MDLEDLRAQLAELIEQRTGTSRDALLADTPLADLGHDSLAVLEIGFCIEEAFGVNFDGKITAQNLPRNLTDVAKVLHAHLPQGHRAAGGAGKMSAA